MYQIIAEKAVKVAEEYATESPDNRFGAIKVALEMVSACRDADAEKTEIGKRDHIYKWASDYIDRLQKII